MLRGYSKMGMGNRLKGVDKGPDTQALDVFGRYCYLAVTSELDYPLNIRSDVEGVLENGHGQPPEGGGQGAGYAGARRVRPLLLPGGHVGTRLPPQHQIGC